MRGATYATHARHKMMFSGGEIRRSLRDRAGHFAAAFCEGHFDPALTIASMAERIASGIRFHARMPARIGWQVWRSNHGLDWRGLLPALQLDHDQRIAMTVPRFRIAWIMVVVALAALNFAVFRAAGNARSVLLALGAMPMATVLTIGLIIAYQRHESRPFLRGFESF
jgi:hypothetical protein